MANKSCTNKSWTNKSFEIDDGPPFKKPKYIEQLDDETLLHMRPLVSIDYVRVKNVILEDDDGRTKFEEPHLYGSLIVKDCWGGDVVYHRYCWMRRDLLLPDEPIQLSGPTRPISALDTFIITVYFWVSWRDHLRTEFTREIAIDEIVWDPCTADQSSWNKPLQHDVLGKHGTVSVGYSVITEALSISSIDIVWMNESPTKMYGTVKAVGSSTTRMLFQRSADEWFPPLKPQQSLFSKPFFDFAGIFPFPVPVRSYLTIEVDLWDHLSSDNQIALGTLRFAPKFGTQTDNIGRLQVSITCQ